MNVADFIKYLNNEVSEKKSQEFFELLKKNEELEKEFLSIKRIWDFLQIENVTLPDTRKKQMFLEFWERSQKGKKGILRLYPFLRYAAMLLMLLAFPVIYFLGRNSAIPAGSYSTVLCAMGDKSTVFLPDQTKVYLNSGSKLTFNTNFKKGEREVFLEGEAYFIVEKDVDNPFIVKTDGIEAEVLGTEFNLKAYPDENTISATLLEGSLKITESERNTVLQPNQKLIFHKDSKKIFREKLTDTSPETEWKEGRLVFRNESLAELELKLERWFDVDIVFADDLVKTRRFTGILERESILETISYFGFSKYVGYEINGNEITFYTKK